MPGMTTSPGQGVDVALIDSGVAPVDGLRADGQGRQRAGPLVRPPGGLAAVRRRLRTRDAHRRDHRRSRRRAPGHKPEDDEFAGIAPDARIVSVKVAGASGQTDVSQVIAAIDWVVQNRTSGGLNIRVLNLSFGTDGSQDYRVDPLAHAVEVAWRNGIVVVVAAGNAGEGEAGSRRSRLRPVRHCRGGGQQRDTRDTGDDTVPAWSSRGDGSRNPDLLAPAYPSRACAYPAPSSIDAVPPATARLPVPARERHVAGRRRRLGRRGAAPLGSPGPLPGPGEGAAQDDRLAAARRERRGPGFGAPRRARGPGSSRSIPDPGLGAVDRFRFARSGPRLRPTSPWTARPSTASATSSVPPGTGRPGGTSPSVARAGRMAPGTGRCGPARAGARHPGAASSWSGLSWSGLSWSGLSWSGLSWSGLSWSGLSWSTVRWDAD